VSSRNGLAAGALGLGAAAALAWIVDGITGAARSVDPLAAVGGWVVDGVPPAVKTLAVNLFGTADKIALWCGLALVAGAVFAGLGRLAARSPRTALVAAAALVGATALIVDTRPQATPIDILPTLGGGVVWMILLWGWADDRRDNGTTSTTDDGTAPSTDEGIAPTADDGRAPTGDHGTPGRRSLLRLAAGAAAVSAVPVGRALTSGSTSQTARAALALPSAASTTPVAPGADLATAGAPPWQTPETDFFRIDTALRVPTVDPATWSLRVAGEVEHEVVLTWAELLGKPLVERWVTLACVSNEVGGDLVGNARWLGWPVRELLAQARPRADADMVLSRSFDGWTAGTPLTALTDGRDALLAIGMNGSPLPAKHGFPVRLVVPGLYGYVSATKWVTELKVTRFAQDQGYWTPRGWSAFGPVKTASRIDVPRSGREVKAGLVAVAGVAWDTGRGIRAVDVRIDDGPWRSARLGEEPATSAWRQWVYPWDAPPGSHTITVRAQDGAGQWQTAEVRPSDPDGATGLHIVTVRVV
jgi:DMSO/TMAO reductase YedYZ molybdopterin-dependent catalytic subunit